MPWTSEAFQVRSGMSRSLSPRFLRGEALGKKWPDPGPQWSLPSSQSLHQPPSSRSRHPAMSLCHGSKGSGRMGRTMYMLHRLFSPLLLSHSWLFQRARRKPHFSRNSLPNRSCIPKPVELLSLAQVSLTTGKDVLGTCDGGLSPCAQQILQQVARSPFACDTM